ncbi:MAG TPA: hypothetical protein VN756_00860 [Solirubrobacterales bacterium]|nr:hypothetical protein [Solirubrobacterales bacterium]
MADPNDIYQMDFDGEPILVTAVGPGMTREGLASIWERLEALNRDGFEICTECAVAVPKDERGDVLDSSGRCDACRP